MKNKQPNLPGTILEKLGGVLESINKKDCSGARHKVEVLMAGLEAGIMMAKMKKMEEANDD